AGTPYPEASAFHTASEAEAGTPYPKRQLFTRPLKPGLHTPEHSISRWSIQPKAPEDRRSPKPIGSKAAQNTPRGFGLRLSSGALASVSANRCSCRGNEAVRCW